MAKSQPAEVRKRILLLSLLLGLMVGIGVYLTVKAVQQGNYALLAVLPVLVLAAVRLARSLVRLRRGEESAE